MFIVSLPSAYLLFENEFYSLRFRGTEKYYMGFLKVNDDAIEDNLQISFVG